jgi:hypothetical protein
MSRRAIPVHPDRRRPGSSPGVPGGEVCLQQPPNALDRIRDMKVAEHRVFQAAIRKLLHKAGPAVLTGMCDLKQDESDGNDAIQRDRARVHMAMTSEDRGKLAALEDRLRTILPEQYQDCYEDVQPVSMGSAGLKYEHDGNVAWNDIWVTFCDLAMAGGPPHKGILLDPGSQAEIEAEPDRYLHVVKEICRGVMMVTGLAAYPSLIPDVAIR